MAFDFSTLDTVSKADEGADMPVLHPTTGVPLMQDNGDPVTIRLAGEDSDRFRRADRALRNKRLAKSQTGRPGKVTAEEIDSDELDKLVAMTIGWSGVSIDGGDELPATPANAAKLYTRWPWVREQAIAFITDRANFLKA